MVGNGREGSNTHTHTYTNTTTLHKYLILIFLFGFCILGTEGAGIVTSVSSLSGCGPGTSLPTSYYVTSDQSFVVVACEFWQQSKSLI